VTDREYYAPSARGWFSEGMAEYIAVTPYRSGKFSVKWFNFLNEISLAAEDEVCWAGECDIGELVLTNGLETDL